MTAGLRVARLVSAIVRDAATADLLASTAESSRVIARTAAANAAQLAARAPAQPSRGAFALPFWQWQEQNNRRIAELSALHAPMPRPIAAPQAEAAASTSTDDPRSRAVALAAQLRATIQNAANSRQSNTGLGVSSIGALGGGTATAIARRINETRFVYERIAATGNLVDLVV